MMQDYVYVVRSGPVAGGEEAYNDWYTNVHLGDVLAVPGFVSAQRFCLADPAAPDAPTPGYLALYTMRTDDPEGLLATLTGLVEGGQMAMSEAFDMETVTTVLYRALTPVVTGRADVEA
ncbi:hypothetical protein [Novosphingobium lentum]|uniref:hypothetical protein n=1 Tax=Novosphingobium lentum TaxID=145287 RepID=UPI0008297FDC|nr:hypothetical protein [Novosphingobium lentum]